MKRYSGRPHVERSIRFMAQHGAKSDTADSFVESIVEPMDRIMRGIAFALQRIADGDTEEAENELEILLGEYAEDAPPPDGYQIGPASGEILNDDVAGEVGE